ncbi:MAG: Fe-S-containing protein [Thermodesulfobacteriota bacterium]
MTKSKKTKTEYGTDRNTDSEKKARVLNKKKSPLLFVVAGVALLVLLGTAYYRMQEGRQDVSLAVAPATAAAGGTVAYPTSLFADGRARHFDYTDGGQTIRYFILKSADGAIRAAFDACDVCWPEGRGYYQEGDNMVCGNCGRRFASVKINEVKGGCNPAPLARTVQGDQVVINTADILSGAGYFNFENRR